MHGETPLSHEVWEHIPPEAQAYIRALEARVGVLEETVQGLKAAMQQVEATVHQLREQLQQNSRTSSRPPSSDPPQALGQRPHREPSGRRPGGQLGHEGQTRALRPIEEVDVVIPVKPERCSHCQHALLGEDSQPQRHQVTEIPLVQPVVTEYQLHRLVCPACGEATRAEWPTGVPAGGFGPRVQAITALCAGAYHLSKRMTQCVLEDLFGVSMGLGTVAVTVHRSGLVAAYNFNEGSGTRLNDVSGRGNHGTISGAAWTTSGRYGRALSFDGTNDWVTVNDAPSLDLSSGMTLEAWVYPTRTPTSRTTILVKEQPSNLAYALYAGSSSNRPMGYVYNSAQQGLSGNSALQLNTWSHIATTYNGSTLRFYVNGSQVSSRSVSGNIIGTSRSLRIGGNAVWNTEFFRGRIDEIRVYNRALSSTDIRADRNAALPTPSTSTQLLMSSQGISASDESAAEPIGGMASRSSTTPSDPMQSTSAGDSKQSSAASQPLAAGHLEVGEVAIDQTWKRVELQKPFEDPIVVAKALSYREAKPAVVRVRQVDQTGFEISLQPWATEASPHAPEAVGYLVMERGRFRLPDGSSVESGTIETDPTYPKHSITFNQPFSLTPVVMATVTNGQESDGLIGQPGRVNKKGFQLQLRQQETSSTVGAPQAVSYIAWEPSTGTLDGLAYEVSRTARVKRSQFSTITFKEPFLAAPVFLADLQASAGGNPLNLRWNRKELDAVDVKIDEAGALDASGTTPQDISVVGYILIR